jgi:hypothetical protein
MVSSLLESENKYSILLTSMQLQGLEMRGLFSGHVLCVLSVCLGLR